MSQPSAVAAGESAVGPEVATPISGGKKRLFAMVIPALVAGAVAGKVLVAPRLVGPAGVPGAAAKPLAAKKKTGEAAQLFRVDNVIVNPAGSAGTRYLVVSVGFEVDDPAAELELRASDVQLRDAITGLLERQSLQMLTSPGARDSIRLALAGVVKPFLGGATARIYIPQFLIQ